jgi:hypothetical protein
MTDFVAALKAEVKAGEQIHRAWHDRALAAEASVTELAKALENLADYLAGQLIAMEVPPTDEQSDWPRVHEAHAILAKARLGGGLP